MVQGAALVVRSMRCIKHFVVMKNVHLLFSRIIALIRDRTAYRWVVLVSYVCFSHFETEIQFGLAEEIFLAV